MLKRTDTLCVSDNHPKLHYTGIICMYTTYNEKKTLFIIMILAHSKGQKVGTCDFHFLKPCEVANTVPFPNLLSINIAKIARLSMSPLMQRYCNCADNTLRTVHMPVRNSADCQSETLIDMQQPSEVVMKLERALGIKASVRFLLLSVLRSDRLHLVVPHTSEPWSIR